MSAVVDPKVEATAPPRAQALRRILAGQQAALIFVILVLGAVAEAKSTVFLSSGNLIELGRASVVYFIAACPATLLLVGGGLDLSVGAVFASGGVFTGWLIHCGLPWPLALALGVVFGGCLGGVNALLVTRFLIPPFVATLGTFFAVGGMTDVLTGGNPLINFPSAFDAFGQNAVFGIPLLIIYAVVFGVVFHVLLEKTRFGYNSRAVGGNRGAALGSGIAVDRVSTALYALCGAGAALAGIMLAARLSTADPGEGGTGFTFQVLSAAIIGGTSLFGGTGTIVGTALGTILFAEISNGLVVIGVNPLWEDVVTGLILITAVGLDQARRRREFTTTRGK
jgi:ribose transport system permease protein